MKLGDKATQARNGFTLELKWPDGRITYVGWNSYKRIIEEYKADNIKEWENGKDSYKRLGPIRRRICRMKYGVWVVRTTQ